MKKKNSTFSIVLLVIVLLATLLPLSYQVVSASRKTSNIIKTTPVNQTAKITETPTNVTNLLTKKPSVKKPVLLNQIVPPTNSAGSSATPVVANPSQATPTPRPFIPDNASSLPNASFENNVNGWADAWGKDSDAFTLNTNRIGNDGSNSILYTPNQSETTVHLLSERFIVSSASQYTWSQYLNIQGDTGFNFYIDEYDANGNWISGQWKGKVTTAFTGTKTFNYIPTSNNVRLVRLQYSVTPAATGLVTLDTVTFEPLN